MFPLLTLAIPIGAAVWFFVDRDNAQRERQKQGQLRKKAREQYDLLCNVQTQRRAASRAQRDAILRAMRSMDR